MLVILGTGFVTLAFPNERIWHAIKTQGELFRPIGPHMRRPALAAGAVVIVTITLALILKESIEL